MKLKLLTLALDPEIGAFPADPLAEVPGEVVSVAEHFFTWGGLPRRLLIVHHEPERRRGPPRGPEPRRAEPGEGLAAHERPRTSVGRHKLNRVAAPLLGSGAAKRRTAPQRPVQPERQLGLSSRELGASPPAGRRPRSPATCTSADAPPPPPPPPSLRPARGEHDLPGGGLRMGVAVGLLRGRR